MHNQAYPRWAAPFVTAAAGAFLTYVVMVRERLAFSWAWVLAAAGIGFVVGLLIALADQPSKKAQAPRVVWKTGVGPTLETPPESESASVPASESIIGPFLSLLAILLFCAPVVGFALSCAAVFACRNRVGWPKTLSRVAFGLSLLVSLAFVAMLAFAPR